MPHAALHNKDLGDVAAGGGEVLRHVHDSAVAVDDVGRAGMVTVGHQAVVPGLGREAQRRGTNRLDFYAQRFQQKKIIQTGPESYFLPIE